MEGSLALLGFIAASAAAALPGVLLRPGRWYRELCKPAWRPPDKLFGPVWLVLYVCMAISGWLVWGEGGSEPVASALVVFAVQLVLNALWSVLFFGLRRPDLAGLEIVALWLAIAATIGFFAGINLLAAWLLVPYLLWVSFAVALNARIWQLNRGGAGSG